MEEIKGKPRGRNGGRKVGSKDKAPRAPRSPNKNDRELTERLLIRISASLLQRIMIQASACGMKIPDFVRNILDQHVE